MTLIYFFKQWFKILENLEKSALKLKSNGIKNVKFIL